ncbi:MAG TPA: mitochondrial fission ELM1 family protein [Gammaproteobacteria bacterium]|nr:mitochondrial fission ELM1 family protein [Gammaproteobacteria bacterium]
MHCWFLSEPNVGMEVQCRALAEALCDNPIRKTLTARMPWKFLPAWMWWSPFAAIGPGSDTLAPPWPDLLISCGRYAAGVALAIKKASNAGVFTVHIQNPLVPLALFDVVVAPRHDRCEGKNVITTMGSLHGITPALLAREASRLAPALMHLPHPLVTVLVGGKNKRYSFGAQEAEHLARQLIRAMEKYGCGMALTVSRRTGAQITDILKQRLRNHPCVIWDGRGENPYLGFLGAADHIVVTCDSVNMTTEACATGKPVHVIHLPGGSPRSWDFHRAMESAGMTRRFTGELEQWNYEPLLETARVAEEIKQRMRKADR